MSVLVGVGGTGQHVALAYLHLSRLAGFAPAEIVIIDNDKTAETGRALDEWGTTHWIEPFSSDQVRANTPREQFRDEERLLGALFEPYSASAGDRGSEQDADITKGFYAFPHLGATYGRHLFDVSLADVDSEFQRYVLRPLTATDGDKRRLGVSGSITGGCGSGLMPQLVASLSGYQSEKRITPRATVQAVIALQVFQFDGGPPRGTPGLADSRVVSDDVQRANVVSGLAHFRSTLTDKCDRVIAVATPGEFLEPTPNAGHDQQPENPHYIHVLAAALQHLFFVGKRLEDSDRGLHYFSSGGPLLAASLLPVPSDRFLEENSGVGSRISTSEFDARLDGATFQKVPVGSIIERSSLMHWLWTSRVQAEILTMAARTMGEGRWDIHTDLRDVARKRGIADGVRRELESAADAMRKSLAWMRRAFMLQVEDGRGSGWALRKGIGGVTGADGDWWKSDEWESLGLERGSTEWQSPVGSRLARKLVSFERNALGPSDFWSVESPRAPQEVSIKGFVRELTRRAREEAETFALSNS